MPAVQTPASDPLFSPSSGTHWVSLLTWHWGILDALTAPNVVQNEAVLHLDLRFALTAAHPHSLRSKRTQRVGMRDTRETLRGLPFHVSSERSDTASSPYREQRMEVT